MDYFWLKNFTLTTTLAARPLGRPHAEVFTPKKDPFFAGRRPRKKGINDFLLYLRVGEKDPLRTIRGLSGGLGPLKLTS